MVGLTPSVAKKFVDARRDLAQAKGRAETRLGASRNF